MIYAIRVDGHLDDHWSAWLGGDEMTRDGDGGSTVTVRVADQAQLHGVLAALRDIGAVITELRATGAPAAPSLERPLRTARLTLRPGAAGDAGATWAYRRLEPVNEWLDGTPADLDGYRARFTEPARLAATVIVALGERIIGDFMLRREGAEAELGWVLDPAFTGHGYATEAVRELLRHCFQDLGVRRVTANCYLGNDASWRLMERVGMRREQHLVRESQHRSGEWLDTVGYAILAEEFAADLLSP
ncbi:MAG TPA: GNAT family N-acetyltransferase [Nocardioides sp.]|uniref:GNAT family N-acetyltransferase n=1 Tax=Nocardioides sp. TaxID=35761 RepID=UPI002E2F9353|nr:GNAT family N-acetyltransferase [Nocardioides sp.]HEX5089039.1 GNAT family N-acetyltransferase [Nocardioides sp.]